MKKIFFLCFITLSQFTYTQIFDMVRIKQSGSNARRINLVILSDGYQSNELDKFVTDATNLSNSLFEETPYREYKNYFNVHLIKVPSNESGASHPGTATDEPLNPHPIKTVDNYFGSTFDFSGVHRVLGLNISRVNFVLARHFPLYDQALILVNSPYFGGGANAFPVVSLQTFYIEVAKHELGHAFAGLRDEYYAGDSFLAEGINTTQETDPNNVKWANWIGINNIGIHRYCCKEDETLLTWFRPHQDCKMEGLGNPFCSVCIEATVEKIHSLVRLIENHSPQNLGTIDVATPTTFSVDVIAPIPNTLTVKWSLNGTNINNEDLSVLVSTSDLIAGNNQLQVTIEDTTDLLKINNHESIHLATLLWEINSTTSTTLNIEKISSENVNIKLFPNPTQDILYFEITKEIKEDYEVTINDISGKQLMNKHIHPLEKHPQIQLGLLAPGVYFIKFKFENGLKFSKKIIKK